MLGQADHPQIAGAAFGAGRSWGDETVGRLGRSALSWRVAGILFLVGAEAVLYGFSYPFFSLALEKRDLANWAVGLNASFAGAGILIVGPFLPRLIDFFGLRRVVAGLFAISLLSFAALLVFDGIAAWFLSRLVMGACFAALWTTTEIWLNGTVEERRRGRIIGAAMMIYAGAQFLGPLLLSATGPVGWTPLVAAMIPLALGVVVALSIRSPATHVEDVPGGKSENLRLAVSFAGALIGAAFLAGVAETSMQSLLPLYGLAHGLSDAEAARLVALFSLGEAILVGVLSLVADRYGRRRMLQLCAIPAVVLALLLPLTAYSFALLGPLLFLAGGTISGIYMLAVILIGQDFRGQRLAVISTGFAMAYSAGSVVGATPIGLLVDVFGPTALPVSIAVSFLGLAWFVTLRPSWAARDAAMTGADFVQDNAPPYSFADESEAVDVEQAEIGDLQVWDDRQRKERDLEKWFLERASEATRRAAQRYQAGADRLERAEAHQPGKRQGQLRKNKAA
ncbi:MAG: MFS transporter [Bauldia sp.]|nr:MAG: MFS transporter [Bauldia sp.]